MKKRRQRTSGTIEKRRRVYQTLTTKKTIMQCERPYVLFGQAVRALRLSLGMTQETLAEKVGLGRSSIVNIEQGRQRVLLGDLITFAKALSAKPIDLFRAII